MSPFLSLSWRRAGLQVLFVLALGLCGIRAFAAAGEPPGRVGRVADVQGAVWILDTEENQWVAVSRNRPITGGDRLSVDESGRAELNIGSAVLRLDGGTEVQMLELDDQRVRVQLDHGAVALRLRSAELAREFEVVTEEGRFLPQRAGHLRIDRQGDTSMASVWTGGLRFDSSDSALDVNPGQRAEFWREGSEPTRYTWSEIPRDDFSNWVLAQDERDRRNEQAWAERQISLEMTGVDDLDRYGNWDRHPEYGTVWVPTQVAPDWAPYRYGHWAYVRPWGWTWVDDAPWGFAPFHYGRWVSWGGRWCWTPGRYVARPAYSPALVGWVGGGPQVSVDIHVGGRPALPPYVGWVPLGPRDAYVPWYRRRPDDRPVRTGPVMYSNQGVPGGVTVVPSDVLRERRPISGGVVAAVDPRIVREVSRGPQSVAPPAPPTRVVAVPGGGLPLAPGRVAPPARIDRGDRGERGEPGNRFDRGNGNVNGTVSGTVNGNGGERPGRPIGGPAGGQPVQIAPPMRPAQPVQPIQPIQPPQQVRPNPGARPNFGENGPQRGLDPVARPVVPTRPDQRMERPIDRPGRGPESIAPVAPPAGIGPGRVQGVTPPVVAAPPRPEVVRPVSPPAQAAPRQAPPGRAGGDGPQRIPESRGGLRERQQVQ